MKPRGKDHRRYANPQGGIQECMEKIYAKEKADMRGSKRVLARFGANPRVDAAQ